MVDAMLQFTTPSLLAHQLDPAGAQRRGNRHAAMTPHGIYPAAGTDAWLALAVDSEQAFAALAGVLGRVDWAADASLKSLAGRRLKEDEIDAAIAQWAATRNAAQAADELQRAGIAAAPIAHADDLDRDPHLEQADFFIDLIREFSGPQRQAGLSIVRDGRRLGARQPAPLLGEHTWDVLSTHAGLSRARYDELVAQGVISFAPAPSRNNVAGPAPV